MAKLTKRQNKRLSRLTDEQLALDFEINVQREAWAELSSSKNIIIRALLQVIENDINTTQNHIDKNKLKCKKLVSPFLKSA